MRISDWSSDVCSSDLAILFGLLHGDALHTVDRSTLETRRHGKDDFDKMACRKRRIRIALEGDERGQAAAWNIDASLHDRFTGILRSRLPLQRPGHRTLVRGRRRLADTLPVAEHLHLGRASGGERGCQD